MTARLVEIAEHLHTVLETMSRDMGTDVRSLVNQAVFNWARRNGYPVTSAVPAVTAAVVAPLAPVAPSAEADAQHEMVAKAVSLPVSRPVPAAVPAPVVAQAPVLAPAPGLSAYAEAVVDIAAIDAAVDRWVLVPPAAEASDDDDDDDFDEDEDEDDEGDNDDVEASDDDEEEDEESDDSDDEDDNDDDSDNVEDDDDDDDQPADDWDDASASDDDEESDAVAASQSGEEAVAVVPVKPAPVSVLPAIPAPLPPAPLAAEDSVSKRARIPTSEINALLGEVDSLLVKRTVKGVDDTTIQPQPVFVLELHIEGTTSRCIVGEEPVTIGRASHCNLVVDSPDVSREHAIVKRVGEVGYLIEDKGSSNGTWLGDAQVEHRMVRDGDVYRIGVAKIIASIRSEAG